MHCVLLNSPCGDGYWRLHRSVEVLGYHEQEVQILLALYLENLAPDGMENYLSMLHRGRVECNFVPAWPLPQHPDEAMAGHRAKDCVLRQLYESAFTRQGGTLTQRKGLTKWDTWHSVAERRVIPKLENRDDRETWQMSESRCSETGSWVPFTTWRLGPFKESAFYLVTCALRFTGETYNELVDRKRNFTIDGPLRLLTRLKCEDLLRLSARERTKWASELSRFEDSHLLLGDEYDVIILVPPLAEQVRTYGQIDIASAPLQPARGRQKIAERFITSDHRFSMALEFAAEVPSQTSLGSVAHLA
jgi:hypothetical protein